MPTPGDVDEVKTGGCNTSNRCGMDTCRGLMYATAILAVFATALALAGGIMDLCGTGDPSLNGGLATAGGALAFFAVITGFIAAYRCVRCTFCAPKLSCG